jgi:hypothetical protein
MAQATCKATENDDGIWVYDQWQGQPVYKRLIALRGRERRQVGQQEQRRQALRRDRVARRLVLKHLERSGSGWTSRLVPCASARRRHPFYTGLV